MWRHIKQILQVILLAIAMLVSCSRAKVLGKATKSAIAFYLVPTTLPNYNRVIRLSTHTRIKFQILPWSKSKVPTNFFFSLPRCAKGNQEILKNSARVSAYHVVQTLYCTPNTLRLRERNVWCIHPRVGLIHLIFGLFYFVDNI